MKFSSIGLKIAWVVVFLLGVAGVGQRLFAGKEIASYGSYVPWGLWVAVYIYAVGLSAGAFLLSSAIYVFGIKRLEKVGKLALLTALTTLVAALFSIWFDLGHMWRFYKIFTQPNFFSMMAWMVWLYTAYFLLLLAEFWLAIRPDLGQWVARGRLPSGLARVLSFGKLTLSPQEIERDRMKLRVLGILGVPLAVAFHGGVGALFGVIGARPYWHSALYPILFLVSALASGGALLTFLVAAFWPDRGRPEHRELVTYLGRITLGLLALDVLLEWAEFSINLYGAIPSHTAAFKLVIFGPYWWAFWIVRVALGIVVPAILLIGWPRSIPAVGTATGLIAVAFVAVRLNIVIPGLAVPELKGLAEAFAHPRLSFDYVPSLEEWLVTLFVISVGTLLFYVGYRYLPVVEAKS